MSTAAWVLVVAVFALVPPALSATGEDTGLLAEEAEAEVPAGGRSRVRIEGITGSIVLVGGPSGTLGVRSALGGRNPAPLPVAVWAEASDLVVRPLASGRDASRRLELNVPPGMRVEIRANDSRIFAERLGGELHARGRGLAIEASGVEGPVAVDLERGSITARNLASGLVVRGEAATVRIEGVRGGADVRLLGIAHVALGGIEGPLVVDLDQGSLSIRGVEGEANVAQRGGTARIEGIRRGGRLLLRGTSAIVARSAGNLSLEGDLDLRIEEIDGAIRVDLDGGSLEGKVLRSAVDVRATGPARVSLERVAGRTVVEGAGVSVSVRDGQAPIEIRTSDADAEVDGSAVSLTVEIEGGDFVGRRLMGPAVVSSRGGEVRLEDLTGPVRVQADGGNVRVAWAANPATQDSTIRNDGGPAEVEFAPVGDCRVEAESREGVVESSLAHVEVLDGGSTAKGSIGTAARPVVRIAARDDVRLSGGPRRDP